MLCRATYRGFESRPFRQNPPEKSLFQGAFRHFFKSLIFAKTPFISDKAVLSSETQNSKSKEVSCERVLCLLIVLVLVLSLGMSAIGASPESDISVVLDGTPIEFDVPPQIVNNRTMVP